MGIPSDKSQADWKKNPSIVRKLTPTMFYTVTATIQLSTNAVVSRLSSAELAQIAAVMMLVGKRKHTSIDSSTIIAAR